MKVQFMARIMARGVVFPEEANRELAKLEAILGIGSKQCIERALGNFSHMLGHVNLETPVTLDDNTFSGYSLEIEIVTPPDDLGLITRIILPHTTEIALSAAFPVCGRNYGEIVRRAMGVYIHFAENYEALEGSVLTHEDLKHILGISKAAT